MQLDIMKELQIAVDAAKARHEEAVNVLPGGNTRTILHTDPFPIYIKQGNSYQVTSEDDVTWVDVFENLLLI